MKNSDKSNDDSTFFGKTVGFLEKFSIMYNKVLHAISSMLLFLIMFLTLFDVIGRYFFNSPIKGTYELTALSLAIMIFFSLGAAQIKGDHIEIDFLIKKLGEKVQYYWNFGVYLVLFVVVIVTSWQLWVYGQRMMEGNNVSGDLGIELYLIVFLTAIGALGFALALISSSAQNLYKAVNAK